MNCPASTSKEWNDEDQDVFEDSTFFNNFEDTDLNEVINSNSKGNKIDKILDNSSLNVSALCCDEEICGYDKLTGRTWIYPTNYPVRDYQFNIIKATILKNTLVSLPTGLGKTFIAAVIMYNYYRWYPLGKIVFTAPTRPLVAQQIDACHNIIAIPPDDTIEMTGHMQGDIRKKHWKNKRVFFATPQVIYNDIKSGICPGDKIRCLVFDEAHRARGNYSYCLIVSLLSDMGHKTYRILALSATPGSKVENVVNVVKNLHITHLELRNENCLDVAPYSHARKINTVIIPLGPELTQLRQQYVQILDCYARRLKQLNILPHNVGNLSKGRIVMLYKEFQTKDRGARHPQHNYIMKDFTLLIALYHGLELLVKHGSRVFLNFFDEHPEKSWIQSDDQLTALLERLRDDLGINPLSLNRSILPDGTIPEVPSNLHFGHPKFYRLKEIMLEHFNKKKEQDTRAIVFCEYRESVHLVHCLLLQCRPLIVAQMFVGQGASGKDGKATISQKQQLRVMNSFREGSCNTLVATCVAEEGLDVGSVDLIICFDISTRSPIRLVQRCGRTGRERVGQVHILVTEGREHQTLLDCMRQRDGLNAKILQSKEIENNLFKLNPRMLPHDHMPECQKMYITVTKRTDAKDNAKKKSSMPKKGQKDVRAMFLETITSKRCNTSSKNGPTNSTITEEEFRNLFPNGYQTNTYFEHSTFSMFNKEFSKSVAEVKQKFSFNMTSWLEWQRTLQTTVNIGHSSDTKILSSLLQYSDAKTFNLPASTQNPSFSTQTLNTQILQKPPVKQKVTKTKQKINKVSPTKKDGDIRAIFSTAIKSTKNYTKVVQDLGLQNDGNIPTTLIDLLVDMSTDNTKNNITECLLCKNEIECKVMCKAKKHIAEKSTNLNFLKFPKYPDLKLLSDINSCILQEFIQIKQCIDEDSFMSNNNNQKEMSIKEVDENINCRNNNFDLEFDLNFETSPEVELNKSCEETCKNFDIGDIEDIFINSSPEEKVEQNEANIPKQTLEFFGLHSIDDIFADSDDSILSTKDEDMKMTLTANHIQINEHNNNKFNNDVIRQTPSSPSVLSGSYANFIPTSPIITSQNIRKVNSNKNENSNVSSAGTAKPKRLFKDLSKIPHDKNLNDIEATSKYNLQSETINMTNCSNVVSYDNSKSMLTITQLVDMVNNGSGNNSVGDKNVNKCHESKIEPHVNDFTDRGRSCLSPVIFTQAEKKELPCNKTQERNIKHSLIILDSDSDSMEYESDGNDNVSKEITQIKSEITEETTPCCKKRKTLEDDEIPTGSPYFYKRFKSNDNENDSKNLQDKLKKILSLNKRINISPEKSNNSINYMFTSPIISQKENVNPTHNFELDDYKNIFGEDNIISQSNKNNYLEKLQIFKRDNKSALSSKLMSKDQSINDSYLKKNKPQITCDSDDEFESKTVNYKHKSLKKQNNKKNLMKNKRKANEFIDLEAVLSDHTECEEGGDEMSDESIGSIIDFICDDDNAPTEVDMQAHYLRSIKNPLNGVFKIPELPTLQENIYSQDIVENDNYEMDSFCVDSHIGLTQVNDVSELELAEMKLQRHEKRKVKHKSSNSLEHNDSSPSESPLKLKPTRNRKLHRQIHSDSDSSS